MYFLAPRLSITTCHLGSDRVCFISKSWKDNRCFKRPCSLLRGVFARFNLKVNKRFALKVGAEQFTFVKSCLKTKGLALGANLPEVHKDRPIW